jgi:hypothetical protein
MTSYRFSTDVLQILHSRTKVKGSRGIASVICNLALDGGEELQGTHWIGGWVWTFRRRKSILPDWESNPGTSSPFIYISIQRDATRRSVYSLFHCNLLIYSTCFGCHLHPSAGVQETVVVDHWYKLYCKVQGLQIVSKVLLGRWPAHCS